MNSFDDDERKILYPTIVVVSAFSLVCFGVLKIGTKKIGVGIVGTKANRLRTRIQKKRKKRRSEKQEWKQVVNLFSSRLRG